MAVSNKHYSYVTADEISNPTDLMLSHPEIVYILNTAPFTKYVSNGSALVLHDTNASAADNTEFKYYIGCFGDSITNGAVYTDGTSPDGKTPPAWHVSDANNNYLRAWGWLSWVGALSLQRAQVVKSWARQTNGLLTAGTAPAGCPLSYQVTQALADPEWKKINRVAIMIGFNDSAYTIAECVTELLRQIRRINKTVDLITPPPRSDGAATSVGGDGMQGWAWLAAWRLALKRIADESRGRINFIDAYSKINLPTTTPDGYATNHSYDTIHPSNIGAYKIADAYVSAMFPTGLDGDLDIWPTAAYAGSAGANGAINQGFSNPTFATASGGSGTGVIAGSLTITQTNATHVGTVAACTIPGGNGNMQTLAITSTAPNGIVTATIASVHAAGGAFLAEGDAYFAQVLVRINSGGIYPLNMRLRTLGFRNPTNWFGVHNDLDATKEFALPLIATRTFLLRTPIMYMPSGGAFTVLNSALSFSFAAAGACTVDFSNWEIRRLLAGSVYS